MRTNLTIAPVLDNGKKVLVDLEVKFRTTPSGYAVESYEYDESGISFDDMLSIDAWINMNKDIIVNMLKTQVYG